MCRFCVSRSLKSHSMGVLTRLLCCLLLTGFAKAASSPSAGLKWVHVNVPQYRMPGETALLQCDFDLGNDSLYSVKWYKEHEEFYRYMPKQSPRAHSYRVEGVQVDMSKSDSRRVVLHSVNWKSSGVYRCEVSAEAPSFASAQSEARMEVVFLPQENPIITGVELQYQIGDEINLNCTSGKSHPASILHWYINQQQIQKPEALIPYPPEHHEMGLISSMLGLRFRLSNHHFRGGSMRVKCVASIAPILYSSDRESVVQTQNLAIQDMREALLLVKSSTSKTAASATIPLLILVVMIIT